MKIGNPAITALAAAFIVAPTATAHADPTDEAFLNDLAKAGIHHFPLPAVHSGDFGTTIDLTACAALRSCSAKAAAQNRSVSAWSRSSAVTVTAP